MTPDFAGALRNNDVEGIRELLHHGAHVNARDAAGNTPLMHAAVYGTTAAMQLLIDKGAEVNATNNAGATALMRAAFDYNKVQLLVQRGAEVNVHSALGNTALLLAARPANSHRTVAFLLSRGADAKATNFFGSTALMAASAGGDERTVKLLLQHGADANAQPTQDEAGFVLGGGRTALMWAAFRGNQAIMKVLLDAGANPNAMTGLGSALAHTGWANRTEAARLLLQRGAKVDLPGPMDGYTALHWAASNEDRDSTLAKLLLKHGANPNQAGGEEVDAFLGTPQTPLMLARRRGDVGLIKALAEAGATDATPDRIQHKAFPDRTLPDLLDEPALRAAITEAVRPLQKTSLESKEAFVRHASRQNCTSCHQQHLPMTAIGLARKQGAKVDREAEGKLIRMVLEGELMDSEVDWQPLFHPDAVFTKGYELLATAAQDLPANEKIDSWVHHLAGIQGKDGQWHNNLPRPPIQTDDIGATALAVQALQRYAIPGRKAEFRERVERARRWLWSAEPRNNEGRIYQLLGLAWAGESPQKLKSLAAKLISEQRSDGGWAQLPGLQPDAYATGQAVYALRVAASMGAHHPAVDKGLRYLLKTQLGDGTWHVRRRAFPFQPTMNSGFPHGRDSWISAAGSSWAVMALSVGESNQTVAAR